MTPAIPPDASACRLCRAADASTGFHTYSEACNDEHTDEAVALAEAIGASIWGDEPCPSENLAVHVEDAVAVLAHLGQRGPFEVWRLEPDDLTEAHIDADYWRDFSLFAVGDPFGQVTVFGVDPTEEGMALPRPFCELVARFF